MDQWLPGAGADGKMGRDYSAHRVSFENGENVLKRAVEHNKNHFIGHCTWANCMACELYLNNTVTLKRVTL